MRTAIVILNWNTKDYLMKFLPPLIESVEGQDATVIVADNASSDGSLEAVASAFPQIRTIQLSDNFGFTGGYNRAIAFISDFQDKPEYLVLINSDILVTKQWLAPLTDWLDSHPDCAVCGPKLHALKQVNGDYAATNRFEYAGAAGGYIDRYGFPFCRGRVLKRTEEDLGQYDTPTNVMWISGACMATRLELWTKLGGFDDRFFAHMEEIDYCWRAQLFGYKVSLVPQSCVSHLGGGTLPQSSPFKLKLNYRNGLLLLDNNLAATIGRRAAKKRICTRIFIDCCSAVAYLLNGSVSSYKAVIEAHREYHILRRKSHSSASIPACEAAKPPIGLINTNIILQSLLHGKRIFQYLIENENSY